MEDLLQARRAETEVAALLVALRMKGESAEEIAAAAIVLRKHMTRLLPDGSGILDTCGMGGDNSHTFNISTATALVVAGAGIRVVKHGNRAISSRCGSADVLQELGIRLAVDVATARQCLHESGCVFCFAPHFHPALRQFADLRRRLGIRTLFNLLGPLANPAGAEFQLLGVARPELLDPVAGAIARLGTSRTVLVCGANGLDEASLDGPTLVRIVEHGTINSATWCATDFGLAPCTIDELRVDSPAASAAVIREILAGSDGAATRIVLANATAALLAAQRVTDLKEGVGLAGQSIHGGGAARVLERIVQTTNGRESCHEKSSS